MFDDDDLKAAVAAGIVTESQAAGLRVLAETRAGHRAGLTDDDEPFEFFRGFAEIFVAVGLTILFTGAGVLAAALPGKPAPLAVAAAIAGAAWMLAGFFTLRRRMNLPSMVLATAFGGGTAAAGAFLAETAGLGVSQVSLCSSLLAVFGMGLWYRRFRLPFSVFILGAASLFAVYGAIAMIFGPESRSLGNSGFDLRDNPVFSVSTLLFGAGAFLAGMWFDLRDPHRLGRHSATAFWLHILAAGAMVNTIATTALGYGGGAGTALTALALILVAALALVIDRRSFLTAGIVYLALVIAWLVRGDTDGTTLQWALILMLLGGLLTALGAWWVQLRTMLMRALPDFPGKSRLPPWS
jgi:hypothetical protein